MLTPGKMGSLMDDVDMIVSHSRCGKNYESNLPPVTLGGTFPVPAQSKVPLMAFRYAPAIRSYLAEDIFATASMLIDSLVPVYP